MLVTGRQAAPTDSKGQTEICDYSSDSRGGIAVLVEALVRLPGTVFCYQAEISDELVLHVFEEKSIHSHDCLEDYLSLSNVTVRVRQ